MINLKPYKLQGRKLRPRVVRAKVEGNEKMKIKPQICIPADEHTSHHTTLPSMLDFILQEPKYHRAQEFNFFH